MKTNKKFKLIFDLHLNSHSKKKLNFILSLIQKLLFFLFFRHYFLTRNSFLKKFSFIFFGKKKLKIKKLKNVQNQSFFLMKFS